MKLGLTLNISRTLKNNDNSGLPPLPSDFVFLAEGTDDETILVTDDDNYIIVPIVYLIDSLGNTIVDGLGKSITT